MSGAAQRLIDQQREAVLALESYLAERQARGELTTAEAALLPPWPDGSALVLGEDTAVELGNPAVGSLSAVLWQRHGGNPSDTRAAAVVQIVGPDLPRLGRRRDVAFGSVVLVELADADDADDGDGAEDGGSGGDERAYRRHLALSDALWQRLGELDGLLVRSRPSEQRLWCRIARPALERGQRLVDLGGEQARAVQQLGFIAGVRVVLIIDRPDDLLWLRPSMQRARRAVAALVKRSEEQEPECARCEYADICACDDDCPVDRARRGAKDEAGNR